VVIELLPAETFVTKTTVLEHRMALSRVGNISNRLIPRDVAVIEDHGLVILFIRRKIVALIVHFAIFDNPIVVIFLY